MSHRYFRYFLMVIMLVQPMFIDAKPVPKKGKFAFGAGILGGALAGAALNHALSQPKATEQHVYHHNGDATTAPPQTQTHSRTITNGPIQANGCYEQTIHEPNLQNPTQFTETVHLVCPAGAQGVAAAQPVMPPQIPIQGYPPQNPPLTALTYPQNVVGQANTQQIPAVAPIAYPPQNPPLAPVAVPPAVPQQTTSVEPQPPQPPSQPIPQANPVATQQNPPLAPMVPNQNPILYPPQVVATQNPQQPPTSQVYVLSKKTGFYGKSNAMVKQPIGISMLILAFVVLFLSSF